jgi:hypothetical protein
VELEIQLERKKKTHMRAWVAGLSVACALSLLASPALGAAPAGAALRLSIDVPSIGRLLVPAYPTDTVHNLVGAVGRCVPPTDFPCTSKTAGLRANFSFTQGCLAQAKARSTIIPISPLVSCRT